MPVTSSRQEDLLNKFEDGDFVQPEQDVAKSSDRTGLVLGESVWVNNMVWTPVLWDDMEDPTFFKTGCLEEYTSVQDKLQQSVGLEGS